MTNDEKPTRRGFPVVAVWPGLLKLPAATHVLPPLTEGGSLRGVLPIITIGVDKGAWFPAA